MSDTRFPTFRDRHPRLAEQLAEQAKLFGQVTNEIWFARQIAAELARGDTAGAEVSKRIAERHGIDWRAGEAQLARVHPMHLTIRQAP